MPNRFINKAQGGIKPVLTITNQGIIQGAPLNQARFQQHLHLVAKTKGAGRSDFLLVLLDVAQRLAAVCFRDAIDDIGEFPDVSAVNLTVEQGGNAGF